MVSCVCCGAGAMCHALRDSPARLPCMHATPVLLPSTHVWPGADEPEPYGLRRRVLDDVTGFFVCWPPPLVNVLTPSALRSGDARALDLSLAARLSHRA